ncbi:MAG: VanZ family protein [Nitrospirae bacterium]|nr:VanZ family protein [Nitrospirota bacterium]
MKDSQLLDINRHYLGIICLCVIAIILFAGLWPREFNFENQVDLLADGKGIRFSGRGILYSPPLVVYRHQNDESAQGSLTIEMAVQPDKEWGRSLPIILAVDDGEPCERLLIGQWKKHLIIRSRRNNACFQSGNYAEISLENALTRGKAQFITIASGKDGTTLSIAGAMVKKYQHFSILKPGEVLSGRLILGNSSTGNRSWQGTAATLAIHDQVLSSEEVLRDYTAWRDTKDLSPAGNRVPIAYYRFDERAGSVIKDHSGQGNDLIIPERFAPLHRQMLTPPWEDFQPTLKYARDVAINILGFIPFGFYIAWYLSERGISRLRVVIIVLMLGIGASLFIEIVQAYLPERTSQFIDVITNSSGTAIGIYLWHRYLFTLRQSRFNH